MKKFLGIAFILGAGLAFFSCKDKEKKEGKETEKTPVADTVNYYPVNVFLGEEVASIIHSGAKIYKTTTINKIKADSIAIDTVVFNKLAQTFLEKDVTASSMKRFYKENIFRSLATNSITFNYTTINPDLEIRTVDANVEESSNKLKRVDIRVISTKNDSAFTESYSWELGTKFYITKYAEGKDGKGISSVTTVTWHNKRL